jgi:hypothetical protein
MTRKKILHYRSLYTDLSDPIVFMPVAVNTSSVMSYDFLCFLLLHDHRETSTLTVEFPEESDQFHFIHTVSLDNPKGSPGVILGKTSVMRFPFPYSSSR